MKNIKIIVAVVVVIIVAAFLGRHQLKSMMGMSPSVSPEPTAAAMMEASPGASAMAPSDNIYKTATDPKKGVYLTDFDGKTLYIFDKDTKGVSNCYNGCEAAWPIYTSGATAEKTLPENITVVKRTDGKEQFAWKGMPLYYYAEDAKAGDILGDGVGGIWHIVKP